MSKSTESLPEDLLNIVSFSERIPFASKMANNAKWAQRRLDGLDLLYPDTFDDEYRNRVEDNFLLMSGLPMKNYTKTAADAAKMSNFDLTSEGIGNPYTEIEDFPVIAPIVERQYGDRKKTFLRFAVTDSSPFTQNYIREHRETTLKTTFEQKLIGPARQQALLQWQMENGVQDLFSLNPQQRQQLQSDVQSRVEQIIPKDIFQFMRRGAMGKQEETGQAIAKAIVASQELKDLFDWAYKKSYATDAAIFYSSVRRNKPFTELVDPLYFNTGGRDDIYIDKNPWFKRIMHKHPVTVWNEYSDKWNKEDIRKFGELVNRGGGAQTADKVKDEKFLMAMDFEGQTLLEKQELLTEEGQQKYAQFFHKYSGGSIKDYERMRVLHGVWSSLCKMKCITKNYGDGEIGTDWFNEDYEFNPANGDLKEEIKWVQQYWEGEKISQGANAIYANLRPVQYSRRDITDPYVSVSPFSGGWYNHLGGDGHRRTSIDMSKTYLHAINFQMKTIRDREATDLGKVVLMTVAAKPKGWSWGKLIEVVRATKLLPIRAENGLTALDVQFFKEINLSNLYEILPRVNYLQFLMAKVGEIMADNPARAGVQAASTSVSNNMSNLQRSFSQTAGRDAWLNKIIEHVLENQVYLGKRCIKNGNLFLRYVMDDLGIGTIDIDVEELDDVYFGVRVLTDDLELQKVDMGKELLVPFIQNKGLSYKLAIETLLASTRGELLNIADEAEFMVEMQAGQNAQVQKQTAQEMAQYQQSIEKDLLEFKSSLKKVEDGLNNDAKKEMAALQSMTLAHANDINNNQINDYGETADKDREFKREELIVKDTLERDKAMLEDKWNTMELAALREKTAVMAEKVKVDAKKKKPVK